MAHSGSLNDVQTHRRSISCSCEACNEDLLVFSDDENGSETEITTDITRTDMEASFETATVEFLERKNEKRLARRNRYDPSNKGDATWDGYTIYTADGWILSQIPIRRIHYESVKGIDLVRWFTENYVKEQKAKEEQRKQQTMILNTQPTPLPSLNEAPVQDIKVRRRERRRNRKQQQQQRLQSQPQFLTLPAEIRNKIYSYLIPDSRILVRGNKPGKQYTKLKSCWNPCNNYVRKPRYRLRHILDNDDINDERRVQSAILLVCKKIKQEIGLFIYAQLTFCFDSTKVLRKFIDRSTAESLRAITKLELLHVGYGEPKLTKNRLFKQKHDRNWREACQLIAEEMVSVNSLELTLLICDWPVTLREDDGWMNSALEIVSGGPLKHVKVTLAHSHNAIGKDRLARAARRLEDRMMSEEGRSIRDEKEANLLIHQHLEAQAITQEAMLERLKMLPPVQAKRVLRVVMAKKDGNVSATKGHAKDVESNTAGHTQEGNDGV